MGKKIINQASMKISKNISDHNKKQLNSLIKVLRPKVYITDSSSFKKLVQELTGNGESIISPQLPPPKPAPPVENVVKALDIVEDPESSLETSFDVSVNSFEFFAQVSSSPEELNQSHDEIYFVDTASDPFLIHDQQADLFGFQDLESLLLDVDQHPFCSSYSRQFYQEEVSIYDYELSELL